MALDQDGGELGEGNPGLQSETEARWEFRARSHVDMTPARMTLMAIRLYTVQVERDPAGVQHQHLLWILEQRIAGMRI